MPSFPLFYSVSIYLAAVSELSLVPPPGTALTTRLFYPALKALLGLLLPLTAPLSSTWETSSLSVSLFL